MVSDSDYEWVNRFKWHAHRTKGNVYAARSAKAGEQTLLHRLIKNMTDPKVQVDHYPDKAGLNCQRNNLRVVNNGKNSQGSRLSKRNATGFKGVCWSKRKKLYTAQICIEGKQTTLGYDKKAEKCALMYDRAARRLYGCFAMTNAMMGLL